MAFIPGLVSYHKRSLWMFKSFYKFIHALTRLQLRHKANRKAVDKALEFVLRKLGVENAIYAETSKHQSAASKQSNNKHDCIYRWIVKTTKGKNFSREDLTDEYEAQGRPCKKKSKSTLRKRISEIAKQVEQGIWRVKKIL